jgi:hypothetical protein
MPAESPPSKEYPPGGPGSVKSVPIPTLNIALKAKYSAYSTLIFFLIANPETYRMVQTYFGSYITVATEGGCPTPTGFFLHTLLFFGVLWGFMLFPRDP